MAVEIRHKTDEISLYFFFSFLVLSRFEWRFMLSKLFKLLKLFKFKMIYLTFFIFFFFLRKMDTQFDAHILFGKRQLRSGVYFLFFIKMKIDFSWIFNENKETKRSAVGHLNVHFRWISLNWNNFYDQISLQQIIEVRTKQSKQLRSEMILWIFIGDIQNTNCVGWSLFSLVFIFLFFFLMLYFINGLFSMKIVKPSNIKGSF